MRALLTCWRFTLTNALLIAFILALAHGGWPIWVAAALSILVGGGIDEAVGDDHERIGASGPLSFDINLYATLPLLVIVTYLLLCLIAPLGSAGPPAVPMPITICSHRNPSGSSMPPRIRRSFRMATR